MSGEGWAEAFLEMMSVERAAAANTLRAYGRDLEDASAFLASRGLTLASAGAEDVEAYFTSSIVSSWARAGVPTIPPGGSTPPGAAVPCPGS